MSNFLLRAASSDAKLFTLVVKSMFGFSGYDRDSKFVHMEYIGDDPTGKLAVYANKKWLYVFDKKTKLVIATQPDRSEPRSKDMRKVALNVVSGQVKRFGPNANPDKSTRGGYEGIFAIKSIIEE